MRIDINPWNEEKLIKEAEKAGKSATEYVNFLIEYIEIEIPKIEKIKIQLHPPQPKVTKKMNDGHGFVKNW